MLRGYINKSNHSKKGIQTSENSFIQDYSKEIERIDKSKFKNLLIDSIKTSYSNEFSKNNILNTERTKELSKINHN